MSEAAPVTTSTISEKQHEFVRQEYFELQSIIEDLNKQSLEIKKLSIGLATTALFTTAAFQIPRSEAFIAISVLVMSFWWIDWLWKEFQRAHYGRVRDIEAFLKSEDAPTAPSISSSWHLSFNGEPHPVRKEGEKHSIRSFLWPHVCLPHAPIIIISAVLLFVIPTAEPSHLMTVETKTQIK